MDQDVYGQQLLVWQFFAETVSGIRGFPGRGKKTCREGHLNLSHELYQSVLT